MKTGTFFTQLSLVTLGVALAVFLPEQWVEGWSAHHNFSIGIVLVFVFVSLLLFFLGRWTAASPDKYQFHGVIMASVFLKLVAGLGALFLYSREFMPSNTLFIWIFLITYVVYTVWEVTYMTRLAKMK